MVERVVLASWLTAYTAVECMVLTSWLTAEHLYHGHRPYLCQCCRSMMLFVGHGGPVLLANALVRTQSVCTHAGLWTAAFRPQAARKRHNRNMKHASSERAWQCAMRACFAGAINRVQLRKL